MTGQNDRQDRSLTGQVRDQAGHCPLTGRYLQPCKGNNENKTITTTPRTKQTKRHNSKTNVPSFCGRCMFRLFSFISFFIVGGGGCRGGGGLENRPRRRLCWVSNHAASNKILGFFVVADVAFCSDPYLPIYSRPISLTYI